MQDDQGLDLTTKPCSKNRQICLRFVGQDYNNCLSYRGSPLNCTCVMKPNDYTITNLRRQLFYLCTWRLSDSMEMYVLLIHEIVGVSLLTHASWNPHVR